MTESAAPVRVVEETPVYWRVSVRLSAFQHCRRHHIRRPPGSARSNGRQPEPACRSIRERES